VPPYGATPKQIDGIVYDPRQGPTIIREGSFVVVHPAFCPGVVEIRTSENSLKGFEVRLQVLFTQYLTPGLTHGPTPYLFESHVMGIVNHDPNPAAHGFPDRLHTQPIHHYMLGSHRPIFILFKKLGDDHEPYEPGIDAMIRAIFRSGWQQATREDKLGVEFYLKWSAQFNERGAAPGVVSLRRGQVRTPSGDARPERRFCPRRDNSAPPKSKPFSTRDNREIDIFSFDFPAAP
jgi:hypothetical protein